MNRSQRAFLAVPCLVVLNACGFWATDGRTPADSTSSGAVSSTALPDGQNGTLAGTGAAAKTEEPSARLSFRAMLRDQSRNHVLEEGEQLRVEVDVYNEGPGPAPGVEVQLTGTPGLVERLTTPMRIGDLPGGEHRRVTVTGTVPKLEAAEQVELTLTIQTSGPAVARPTPKKFLMAVRVPTEDLEVLSVGVDQPPRRVKGYEQPDAVGVAIGIGAFRDSTLANSRFAAHDATVMAGYLKQASGIPGERIKVLTDGQALRDDLVAVFETWLPTQARPQGTVYVYISGRAVVEPETGAVSLIPYDGRPGNRQRLYGLGRLHAALAHLPIERAIVMLDISLEPVAGVPGTPSALRWDPDESQVPPGRIVQMIGNTAMQDAHDYVPGQHGLFTYFLLKGLRGEADPKRTGRVLLRELCRYVQTQVQEVAQAEFGNRQSPVCLPSPGGILALEKSPIARLR